MSTDRVVRRNLGPDGPDLNNWIDSFTDDDGVLIEDHIGESGHRYIAADATHSADILSGAFNMTTSQNFGLVYPVETIVPGRRLDGVIKASVFGGIGWRLGNVMYFLMVEHAPTYFQRVKIMYVTLDAENKVVSASNVDALTAAGAEYVPPLGTDLLSIPVGISTEGDNVSITLWTMDQQQSTTWVKTYAPYISSGQLQVGVVKSGFGDNLRGRRIGDVAFQLI